MIGIIGAGIGGLSLALCLQHKGIPYRLYERAVELREVGAGIWVPPNALQVFERTDPSLVTDLRKNGNELHRIMVTDRRLRTLTDLPQDFVTQAFGYATIPIHRSRLQRLLVHRLSAGKLVLGKSLKRYERTADHRVTVEFGDGTTATHSAIIAADGIHSSVRRQLFPESRLRYSGQTCWRGVADYALPDRLKHCGAEMWGNRRRFGFSRIAPGKVYWFAVVEAPPHGSDPAGGVGEELLCAFGAFADPVRPLLAATPATRIHRGDLNDLAPLDRWYDGNICLLGDAAHAMTPDLGQGGAQAIEDAYYLAEHLVAQPAPAAAFAALHRQRKQRVDLLVKRSRDTNGIAQLRYGRGVRNMLFRLLPAALLRKQMLATYQLN